MNKKKIISLILSGILAVSIIGLSGCTSQESTDDKQEQQTEQVQKQASSKLGMPNIKNFYEKSMMKTIMENCDNNNLITYAYVKNDMTGKFTYLGEALGFGLPYGTQYTNPDYIAKESGNGEYAILPQIDPNGLYKAENVDATWIMLIDPNTKQAKPVYVESQVTISPFKLSKNLLDNVPSDY